MQRWSIRVVVPSSPQHRAALLCASIGVACSVRRLFIFLNCYYFLWDLLKFGLTINCKINWPQPILLNVITRVQIPVPVINPKRLQQLHGRAEQTDVGLTSSEKWKWLVILRCASCNYWLPLFITDTAVGWKLLIATVPSSHTLYVMYVYINLISSLTLSFCFFFVHILIYK